MGKARTRFVQPRVSYSLQKHHNRIIGYAPAPQHTANGCETDVRSWSTYSS